MSLFDAAWYRLRTLLRPAAADQERDEEFAFHQTLAEANKAHALRNTTHLKETMRSMGATRWIDQLAQDLRLASRGLKRAPLFTIIVVFTLSLGIGANATVLGVIDTMMFRKLPVPDPDRVVTLNKVDRRDPESRRALMNQFHWTSAPLYRDLRANVRGLDGLAAYAMQTLTVAGERTWSAFVSGNYFDVLGVTPERGRFFRPDDEEIGVFHSVIVISDYVWRTRFDADESILGRKIPIGIEEFTVVGVAPPGFTGLHPEGRTDVWMPYTMANVAIGGKNAGVDDRDGRPMQAFGRLRDGASVSEVEASANAFARELALARPADSTMAFRVLVRDRLTSVELSTNAFVYFTFIWVVIALLHLVACSNVASLMLARAAARRRELGVRLCLGASRRRILVQSLTEASILATLGAVGGLAVARSLTKLVTSMQFMSAADGGLDWRIVAIVSVVTAATVLQFGLIPAIDASRSDPMSVLRGFSAGGRGRHSRAEIVVVVQVAISMMLIVNSAVFLGLVRRQVAAHPGFDARHMLVASVAAKPSRREVDQAGATNDVLTRVRSLPGVRAATASAGSPLLHVGLTSDIVVPGRSALPNEQRKFSIDAIAPGYFAAIGTPLVRGREFTNDDRSSPDQHRRNLVDVVIINETLARRLWPNEDALGKQLRMDKSAIPSTVVGIARDMRDVSINGARPRAYLPIRQWFYQSFDVLIRVDGDPANAVSNIAAALDSSVVESRPTIRTMPSIIHDATQVSRVGSSALSICAGVALILTSVGLYGLVAMWSLRRGREIGIRLALGGTSSHVHSVLLAGAGKIIGTGTIIGLVLAIGLVKLEQGWMGPIVALTPLGIAGSLATFVVIGGFATLLPSLRATRQPVAEVLRG